MKERGEAAEEPVFENFGTGLTGVAGCIFPILFILSKSRAFQPSAFSLSTYSWFNSRKIAIVSMQAASVDAQISSCIFF